MLDLVPDSWLEEEPGFASAREVREAYLEYLSARLDGPREWAESLEETREQLV